MPGIAGLSLDRIIDQSLVERVVAMARPLAYHQDQPLECFVHQNICAATVGYPRSFSFLKDASAFRDDVLLVMDGEVFPDPGELAGLADSKSTAQRAAYCLAQYLACGPDFVKSLNGAFAIAVYDAREKKLHLFTDRFGAAPLYYWHEDGCLGFASSIRSLLLCKDSIGRQYDQDAVAELVLFERVLGEKTLFTDIRRVLPGTCLCWDGNSLQSTRYWQVPADKPPSNYSNAQDAAADFLHRLRQSILKRASDCDAAVVLLSGGLDSRLVLDLCPPTTRAGTFSNRGQAHSVETKLAAHIANSLGHEHLLFERGSDHYAQVAERAVDVAEGMTTFATCHSLGLHDQMLQSGTQAVITGQWFDTFFKGCYSEPAVVGEVYRSEPELLRARRLARCIADSPTIRRVQHQDLMMLALSDEMRLRAADVRERVISDFADLSAHSGNPHEFCDLLSLMQVYCRADWGCQRGLRTAFVDRSPILDNQLFDFAIRAPVMWKKDGQIIRLALRLSNPKLARIKDANTGLPAGLDPLWSNRVMTLRQQLRSTAKRFCSRSPIAAFKRNGRRQQHVFKQSSWHDINALLVTCPHYRSLVETTVEHLDSTLFNCSTIGRLLQDDLGSEAPRLFKLFEMVLTFGLFDTEYGPSGKRRVLIPAAHGASQVKVVRCGAGQAH